MGIEHLNPMQDAAINAAKKHNNLILLSATGSGKTLGFLLPLMERLQQNQDFVQALVVVPSRELALQIEDVFRNLKSGFKVNAFYGGHPMKIEKNSLQHPPAVIIGTPGRIADHLAHKTFETVSVESLILDEFDKSLELGFHQEMAYILSELPTIQYRTLTSATDLQELPDFLKMDAPHKLNFLSGGKPKGLDTKLVFSKQADKLYTFYQLLCNLSAEPTIVFCNHRDAVERICAYLEEKDVSAEFFHGGLEQQDRELILCKFRNGSTRILITTDLAARGLDIPEIKHVIHYQLPPKEDAFIHRNGRTARVNAEGTAYLILAPDEDKPDYIPESASTLDLTPGLANPEKPIWTTLFIGGGKKDKINKIDVVGFLIKMGQLQKEDVGLIEVKDFFSYVAIKQNRARKTMELIKDQKIKGKKYKVQVAR